MPSPERFPQRKRVPWRRLDSEALVLDVKTGTLYPLNSVGTRIWELCDGDRSVADIVEVLVAEFDADAPTIARDADDFLGQLAAVDLISFPSSSSGGAR